MEWSGSLSPVSSEPPPYSFLLCFLCLRCFSSPLKGNSPIFFFVSELFIPLLHLSRQDYAGLGSDSSECLAHRYLVLLLNEWSSLEPKGESTLPPPHPKPPLSPPKPTVPGASITTQLLHQAHSGPHPDYLYPRLSRAPDKPRSRFSAVCLGGGSSRSRKHGGRCETRGETQGDGVQRGVGEAPCAWSAASSPIPRPKSLLTPQSAHVSPSMR